MRGSIIYPIYALDFSYLLAQSLPAIMFLENGLWQPYGKYKLQVDIFGEVIHYM